MASPDTSYSFSPVPYRAPSFSFAEGEDPLALEGTADSEADDDIYSQDSFGPPLSPGRYPYQAPSFRRADSPVVTPTKTEAGQGPHRGFDAGYETPTRPRPHRLRRVARGLLPVPMPDCTALSAVRKPRTVTPSFLKAYAAMRGAHECLPGPLFDEAEDGENEEKILLEDLNSLLDEEYSHPDDPSRRNKYTLGLRYPHIEPSPSNKFNVKLAMCDRDKGWEAANAPETPGGAPYISDDDGFSPIRISPCTFKALATGCREIDATIDSTVPESPNSIKYIQWLRKRTRRLHSKKDGIRDRILFKTWPQVDAETGEELSPCYKVEEGEVGSVIVTPPGVDPVKFWPSRGHPGLFERIDPAGAAFFATAAMYEKRDNLREQRRRICRNAGLVAYHCAPVTTVDAQGQIVDPFNSDGEEIAPGTYRYTEKEVAEMELDAEMRAMGTVCTAFGGRDPQDLDDSFGEYVKNLGGPRRILGGF